jgi:predicted amidohydrolase
MAHTGEDKKVNVGVVQMRITTDLQANIRNIFSHIREASLRRISLLCFPECSLSGYIVNHSKIDYKAIAESITMLQEASSRFKMSLIIGTPWKSRGKIFNAAFVIRPKSGIIRKYYKNDLTEYDRKYFSKGTRATYPFWAHRDVICGVLICRDQNNPMLALRYKRKNVKVLFYLSSHHYGKQEAIYKERRNRSFPIVRAAENMMYVAKSDAVGEQNGLVSMGCSIIVNPKGKVIAEAKNGQEELLKFSLRDNN